MTTKVMSAIKKYSMLSYAQTVVIGLSGGADSVALTHILLSLRDEMKLNLIAAHVNHCIRGDEADRDEKFVREFCEKNSLDLRVLKFDVPKEAEKTGESEEECGRRIRYEFFSSLCKDGVIATAHNLNDAVETFFINLSRGSGLKGLCSIPAKRDNIIRPLINCSREEIELYCKKNGLQYVVDSTNLSDAFTRNKIRHGVLPLLQEINPNFLDVMSRTLDNLKSDEEYLSKLASGFLTLYEENGRVAADSLYAEPESVRKRIIYNLCSEAKAPYPDKKQLGMISDILYSGKGGAVQISEDFYAVSSDNSFFIERKKAAVDGWEIPLDLKNDSVDTPCGRYFIKKFSQKDLHFVQKNILENAFDCDKINGKVFIRSRRDGETVRPKNRGVSKTLKKLFYEENIPVEKRNTVAVLSDDNGVFLVDGICVDERVKITESTKNIIVLEKGE